MFGPLSGLRTGPSKVFARSHVFVKFEQEIFAFFRWTPKIVLASSPTNPWVGGDQEPGREEWASDRTRASTGAQGCGASSGACSGSGLGHTAAQRGDGVRPARPSQPSIISPNRRLDMGEKRPNVR